jgi:kinesin family protein 1
MSSESVKVAVRVRPFNQREKDRNATCIIRMEGVKTTIINPDTEDEKEFAFDYSYWSHDGFDELDAAEDDLGYPGGGFFAPKNRRGGPTQSEFGCEYSSQKEVFEGLGRGVLDNALLGFNCCLFAYGQTGSGKSYSFVGYGANKGVVPQVCNAVFQSKAELEADGKTQLQVTFAMMEIYNEKIRDLLNPDPKTNNDLKVRTTPKGTFVEGVKARAVTSYKAISDTMDAGTASRTVAATQMNATSSRAHTVMTITVKQVRKEDGRVKEISSDMNLVDLAGSERAESTGATGDRLKEGAAINKSLSSLGNVISALAEQVSALVPRASTPCTISPYAMPLCAPRPSAALVDMLLNRNRCRSAYRQC